jgi:hypothetical protein
MGRKSREKWQRRQRRHVDGEQPPWVRARAERAAREEVCRLETELNHLADGEAVFGPSSSNLSAEEEQTFLEDVLAFESVDDGVSLFRGLVQRGMKLPPPEKLNERKCARKVLQIGNALLKLGIFLVGFEGLSPREFYSKLYHEILWEGCYVEKRLEGAVTIVDVSHSMTRAEMEAAMMKFAQPTMVN